MTKRILIFLLCIATLTACNKNKSNCKDTMCDLSFASLIIRFLDKDGEGINVKNYSAVNQRTKDTIKASLATYSLLAPGTYVVIDDSYTRKLSEAGDDIKVSGTDSVSNVTKTAIIKVSGGQCACHISKVSGPTQIKFD